MTNLTTEELAQYKAHCEAAKACDRQTIISGRDDVWRMVAEIQEFRKQLRDIMSTKTSETEGGNVPFSITFFPNGMAAVGDKDGNQIPKYQGRHKQAIEALKADGYDWHQLPDVHGSPSLSHQ